MAEIPSTKAPTVQLQGPAQHSCKEALACGEDLTLMLRSRTQTEAMQGIESAVKEAFHHLSRRATSPASPAAVQQAHLNPLRRI